MGPALAPRCSQTSRRQRPFLRLAICMSTVRHWRDVEGRLIWGIDHFDEAFPLPYPMILCDWPPASKSRQRWAR